jgi:hypothetical protein
MKLSRAQLNYIKNRREELNEQELKIRRIPEEERYKTGEATRELLAIFEERNFYSLMMRLHIVEVEALEKQKEEDRRQAEWMKVAGERP